MNHFQSFLWTFIVLSFLQVIQASVQSSSSASLKPSSSALDINQTRLMSNPGYSDSVSAPSTTYVHWSNSTSPASTGNSGTFNTITYSHSSETAPTVSISSVGSLKNKSTGTVGISSPSSYTAIVSASDSGLPSSISNSSSSNGTLEVSAGESGSTDSKPTNLVNTYDFLSLRPTSASGALTGASSQSQSSTSLQSVSPGPSDGVGFAPLTTVAPLTDDREPSPTLTDELGSDAVTSTDTVEPSNASIESSTNSAWTENLWLTTQKDGHTTVVPVVVGCPGCGGQGRGFILWNFPSIPRVSFKFPKLPKFLRISFPCIPIPGIKKCSKPPRSESSFCFPMFRTLISHRRRVWRG